MFNNKHGNKTSHVNNACLEKYICKSFLILGDAIHSLNPYLILNTNDWRCPCWVVIENISSFQWNQLTAGERWKWVQTGKQTWDVLEFIRPASSAASHLFDVRETLHFWQHVLTYSLIDFLHKRGLKKHHMDNLLKGFLKPENISASWINPTALFHN